MTGKMTRLSEQGIGVLGALLVLAVLVLGAGLLGQQAIYSKRTLVASRQRIEAAMTADGVVNVLATLPPRAFCEIANQASENVVSGSSTPDLTASSPGMDWLKGWQKAGKIENLRVTLSVTEPNGSVTTRAFPSDCMQANLFSGLGRRIVVQLEFARGSGAAFTPYSTEHWMAAP